jgi:hypothetical protein
VPPRATRQFEFDQDRFPPREVPNVALRGHRMTRFTVTANPAA